MPFAVSGGVSGLLLEVGDLQAGDNRIRLVTGRWRYESGSPWQIPKPERILI